MTTLRFTLSAAAFTTLMFGAGPMASAAGLGDSCDTATDCDDGLACEVVGGSGCACPAGANCEPCETIVERACVPGPCVKDADCGDGLVCVTYEAACAGVATPECAPGSDCGAPPPEPTCDSETVSVCAPRWVLPCDADVDCGGGFTCAAVDECTCSGGSPTDPDSGSGSDDGGTPGFAPAPPPDDCTCTPSAEKYCHPDEVACDSDTQCPDGWSCLMATTDIACADREGGSSGCDAAPPAPSEGTCAPSGWSQGGPRSGEDFGVPATAESVNDDGTSPIDPTNGGAVGATATGDGGCVGGGDAFGLGALLLALGLLVHARRRTANA